MRQTSGTPIIMDAPTFTSTAQGAPQSDKFKHFLASIARKNWKGETFYRQDDIRNWMVESKDLDPEGTVSNLEFLFHQVYEKNNFEPVEDYVPILKKDYLLVFSILFSLDCGNFINIFRRFVVDDNLLNRLPETTGIDYANIRLNLPGPNADKCIDEFDKLRWRFFPARILYHMDLFFSGNSYILPFIYKDVINEKGGTANVHHYKIQQDLVSSPELHEALDESLHEVPGHGLCYDLAIKSYHVSERHSYELEIDAFSGCKNQKGIVKYLGQYHSHDDQQRENHHILLEFGDRDLDEYLADTYPPVMFREILAFWKDIFEIVHTIRDLHQLDYGGKRFRGWHGDIKPDNILRVHGKYKLADFGFAKFERDPTKIATHMIGGTHTYGAPECDLKRGQTRTPHLQTIDTWSLGCVLSAVATWVILGSQAYDNYQEYREIEIQRLKQRKKTGERINVPTADDAFHDGQEVLDAVVDWHLYLRNSARKCDTVSYRVLNLIEQRMLLKDPDSRIRLKELCKTLEEILKNAEAEHEEAVQNNEIKTLAPEILRALLDLDKKAPRSATPAEQIQQGSQGQRLKPNNRSNRVAKSKRWVVGKTANREEVIRGRLETTTETDLGIDIHRTDSPGPLTLSPEQMQSDTVPNLPRPVPNPSGYRDKGKGIAPSRQVPHIAVSKATVDSSDYHFDTGFKNQLEDTGTSPLTVAQTSDWAVESDGTENSQTPPYDHSTEVQSYRDLRSYDVGLDLAQQPPPGPALFYSGGPAGHSRSNSNISPGLGGSSPSVSNFRYSTREPVICQEYRNLREIWMKNMKKFSLFNSFRNKVKVEVQLKNYIQNRDIVFVVDNSYSMKQYWPTVEMVLLTLAMKIGPLDEDGQDLYFTFGPDHKVKDAKDWSILTSFEAAMKAAAAEISEIHRTNMAETLGPILDKYLKDPVKRMTLIILTDGLWHGKDDNVENLIAKFLPNLETKLKKLEERWFSIQFVTFGNDIKALKRIQELDDTMQERYSISDVIDAKEWFYEPVNMLIMGSITEDEGDHPPPSPQASPLSPSTPSSQYLGPTANHAFQPPPRSPSANSSRSQSSLKLKNKIIGLFKEKDNKN